MDTDHGSSGDRPALVRLFAVALTVLWRGAASTVRRWFKCISAPGSGPFVAGC